MVQLIKKFKEMERKVGESLSERQISSIYVIECTIMGPMYAIFLQIGLINRAT